MHGRIVSRHVCEQAGPKAEVPEGPSLFCTLRSLGPEYRSFGPDVLRFGSAAVCPPLQVADYGTEAVASIVNYGLRFSDSGQVEQL